MKTLKSAMLIATLAVAVSSTALGGTIIGPRNSRTGTIVGARTGTIIGGRTGNQATPRTDLGKSVNRAQLNQGINLLAENMFGLVRLFLESALF